MSGQKCPTAKMDRKKLGWREMTPAAVIFEPGNSVEYETGSWRTSRPLFHPDRCIQCFLCWVYCPDGSIQTQDRKVIGIDYYHCKGCGVCSYECPAKPEKAITMIPEAEAAAAEAGLGEAKS